MLPSPQRRATNTMVRGALLAWLLVLSTVNVVAGDWNVLSYVSGRRRDVQGISVKNYCESWRINVELNNVRGFDAVPGECAVHVLKYMASTQYRSDVQRAAEEAALFLAESFKVSGDGMDAWVFDVDDTLLSTVPYYKKHGFGGEKTNGSALETWMEEGRAPAVEHMLRLYELIKGLGLKVFIISSREEKLRDATVKNLMKVGYHGWSELIFRCNEEGYHGAQSYKAKQRKNLMSQGYRIWGVMGDQWSSIVGPGPHFAKRTFKLPNPMYCQS